SSKGPQESCFVACERKNDQCSEKAFGARREISPAPTASREDKKTAVKKAVPLPRKVDITPRASAAVPPREIDIPARNADAFAKQDVASPAAAKPAESTSEAK